MFDIKKILSMSTLSILLCNSLNAATFEINKQDEYLKVFKEVFLSSESHRIIVNCNECGLDGNNKLYYDVLDNVDVNSNITFVLNGISATYNKEVFLNNMNHLFLKNNYIVKDKEIVSNKNNIEEKYIEIDGQKILVSQIKKLLKEKEISQNIIDKNINDNKQKDILKEDVKDILKEDIIIEKEILVKNDNKINLDNNIKNEYIVATYNKKEQAERFVNYKLLEYETEIIKTINNKYILKLYSEKDELNFINKYAKDAYLVAKKDNIKLNNEKKTILEVKEKKNNNLTDVVAVLSGKNKKNIEDYLNLNFKNENTNVKKTKNGYYLGYVILDKNDNYKEKLKEIKNISKGAWLINNFRN